MHLAHEPEPCTSAKHGPGYTFLVKEPVRQVAEGALVRVHGGRGTARVVHVDHRFAPSVLVHVASGPGFVLEHNDTLTITLPE